MNWLKYFNDNYAQAVQALTPVIIGLISWFYFKFYKESKLKEGDAASIVKPIFWTIGKKYKILAANKFEKSDDISGYKHLNQNSRPDQWAELIDIRSSYFNMRHQILLKNDSDILTVVISRNGKEKWKTISFNK